MVFSKKEDPFGTIFLGEYVQVVTEINLHSMTSDEKGEFESETPLAVHGFFVDYDETYIYLGPDVDKPSSAVSRSKIVMITIGKPEAEEPEQEKVPSGSTTH